MRLNKIQETFKHHMLRLTADIDTDFECLFEGDDHLLPERVRIYRDNIMLGLIKVLNDHYPAVAKLVGDDFMVQMARHYICAHPPHMGCLSMYGDHFADFIVGFEAAKPLLYLPDVARLELAIIKVESAPDDVPLKAQELVMNTQGRTYLTLRACVYLMTSSYPVAAIRDYALDPDHHPLPDINAGGVCFLVTRPVFKGEVYLIEGADYHLLTAIKQNSCLEEALEQTLNKYPAFDFTGFMQKYMRLGIFRG